MNNNNNNNIIFDIDRLKKKAWINNNTTTNNFNNHHHHNNNDIKLYSTTTTTRLFPPPPPMRGPQPLGGDPLVDPNVVPSVTVVLEGRSICHRVNLNQHSNYASLAKTLRRMFAETVVDGDQNSRDGGGGAGGCGGDDGELDLSNAVPGHVVAYEDLEDDLLLAGDLNWKDFVRVAKRIRILPAKPKTSSRNHQNN